MYLPGQSRPKFSTDCLPTNLDVLKLYKYLQNEDLKGQSKWSIASSVVNEVRALWDLAKIPM